MFLLAIGPSSDDQRNAVQSIVRAHANGWWHHLPDVWIVGGHDHTYWGNLIKPVLAMSGTKLLVLELPRTVEMRMFAVRGPVPEAGKEWLWETYYEQPMPRPD